MELTLFLSKLLGLYMIIGGLGIMLRRSYFMPVVGAFVEERLTRMVVAILELLGGLALILSHNVWDSLPAAIISSFGWALAIEGTLYLLLSDKMIADGIKVVNRPSWYVFGGLFALVLGTYLAAVGFGVI